MDQRQIQTREQSGLVESQLNEDFVYLLRTWGTWVLMVIAVVAVGYVGWQRYTKAQDEKLTNAFSELEAASSKDPVSPESLKAIADTYQGVGSVAEMARLNAADALMKAVRTGIKPGGKLNQDGTLASAEDALSPEERTSNLQQASSLYEQVFSATQGDANRMVFAVGSAFGVAAAAESAGDFDKAKAWYQKIVDLVGDGAFKPHADVARKRIETLDSAREMPKLYARSDIPSLNKKPEAPAPLPAAPDVPTGPAIPEATPAAPAATPATTTPERAPANPAPESTPAAPKGN
ncbi:MAG: tetratricopeptide repeat protein [Planctomycetota bacterium]|nr:tetratricopeptide repeat protein [Planctomycetota bacterium]